MHLRGRKWPDAHSGIGSAATIPGMTFVKRRPLRFTIWVTILLAVGVYVTGKTTKGGAAAFGFLIWFVGSLWALRTGFLAM